MAYMMVRPFKILLVIGMFSLPLFSQETEENKEGVGVEDFEESEWKTMESEKKKAPKPQETAPKPAEVKPVTPEPAPKPAERKQIFLPLTRDIPPAPRRETTPPAPALVETPPVVTPQQPISPTAVPPPPQPK